MRTDSLLGGRSLGCWSDPSLSSFPRSPTLCARTFCRLGVSGCLARSLRRPSGSGSRSPSRPADGFIRCPGGGGRPGRERGRPGAEGAGVPGPINLHQAAAGGPLGANGKMEGPVGRAGRASFVLLPAPLAAAPAPPHFRFKPLEGMQGVGIRGWASGGGIEERGSRNAGTELEEEEGAWDAEGKGVSRGRMWNVGDSDRKQAEREKIVVPRVRRWRE